NARNGGSEVVPLAERSRHAGSNCCATKTRAGPAGCSGPLRSTPCEPVSGTPSGLVSSAIAVRSSPWAVRLHAGSASVPASGGARGSGDPEPDRRRPRRDGPVGEPAGSGEGSAVWAAEPEHPVRRPPAPRDDRVGREEPVRASDRPPAPPRLIHLAEEPERDE